MSQFFQDSPAIPPSATAHELFRGFSFVVPAILEEEFAGTSAPNANGPGSARLNAIAARSTFAAKHHLACGYESIGEESAGEVEAAVASSSSTVTLVEVLIFIFK